MTGRAALVTGSTSGIGKSIAERLLRAGYRVALNYSHDDERASRAWADCKEISPYAVLFKADISNTGEARRLVQQVAEKFRALDVLVNNAAAVANKPIAEMSDDEWDRVLNVDLRGAFTCSQAAAWRMLQQDEGGIILNIGASTG